MDSQEFLYDTNNMSIIHRKLSSLLIVVILFFIFFVFAGVIYNSVMNPKLRGGGENPILIYPHIDHQFVAEGLLASIVIFTGFFGLFLIYSGSEINYIQIQHKKQILGFTLVLFSLLILEFMFAQKS